MSLSNGRQRRSEIWRRQRAALQIFASERPKLNLTIMRNGLSQMKAINANGLAQNKFRKTLHQASGILLIINRLVADRSHE